MNRFSYLTCWCVFLLSTSASIAISKPADDNQLHFTDQSEAAGIGFTHIKGASDAKHVPEMMGAGGLFFDYDSDGHLDIFLLNSGSLVDDAIAESAQNALYRSNGDGTFTDVTEASGLKTRGYGQGCLAADYDNDGDADVYVTHFSTNQLFRNDGDGTFTDVTEQAGVGDERWSVSAAFADYDLDGDLDLYVGNYLNYTLETAHPCYLQKLRVYCGPHDYDGDRDTLYRNNGDGTFTDVTEAAGVVNRGKGLGVLFGDYNDDGYPDIFVANDAVADFLYENNGDGTFTDVAKTVGIAYNSEGATTASMGIAHGDYDNDGRQDLFITTFSLEVNSLFHNDGDGFYTMQTFEVGLAEPSFRVLGFGTHFIDADKDGDLDLFVANGHVWDNVKQITPSLSYRQPSQFFRNDDHEKFTDISKRAGEFFSHKRVARGTALGDYDEDGDLDILVTYNGEPPALLRNDTVTSNHWIRVRLLGTRSNREGIGAKVRVKSGNLTQIKESISGGSYISDSDHRLFFGLGNETAVDQIEVTWPTGQVQVIKTPPVDQTVTVTEP